eukprot:gene22796-biopygen23767
MPKILWCPNTPPLDSHFSAADNPRRSVFGTGVIHRAEGSGRRKEPRETPESVSRSYPLSGPSVLSHRRLQAASEPILLREVTARPQDTLLHERSATSQDSKRCPCPRHFKRRPILHKETTASSGACGHGLRHCVPASFPCSQDRLTRVQLLLTRKPSPLRPAMFSIEYSLLQPRYALSSASVWLTLTPSRHLTRTPTHAMAFQYRSTADYGWIASRFIPRRQSCLPEVAHIEPGSAPEFNDVTPDIDRGNDHSNAPEQLLDGSMCLSPLYPALTSDLHVNTATDLHRSFFRFRPIREQRRAAGISEEQQPAAGSSSTQQYVAARSSTEHTEQHRAAWSSTEHTEQPGTARSSRSSPEQPEQPEAARSSPEQHGAARSSREQERRDSRASPQYYYYY